MTPAGTETTADKESLSKTLTLNLHLLQSVHGIQVSKRDDLSHSPKKQNSDLEFYVVTR